jgi:hypothetical protein
MGASVRELRHIFLAKIFFHLLFSSL